MKELLQIGEVARLLWRSRKVAILQSYRDK